MAQDIASESILTLTIDGLSDELRIVRMSGQEGVSQLFHFRFEFACENAEVDLDAVVGMPGQFNIHYTDGERLIAGIISRFEQGHIGERFTSYVAELVPSVWILTQRYQSRIFQEMSTPDIIEKVLKDAGITTKQYRLALKGSFTPRVYCVQYRETDWNFVARLMEEEGIFYFFEHKDGHDILVISNDAGVHVAIDGAPEVLFREPSGLVEAEEFVFDFRYSQQMRPGKATLSDYNFETPSTGLQKDSATRRNPELEIYDYPGIYLDQGRGGSLSKLRLEALQARRLSAIGQSTCRRLIPGFLFQMADYPRESFNREYTLLLVQHSATQPLGQDEAGGRFTYTNTFSCIPSDVPFRPTRVTPKPVVEGTQTAVVTGPSGEEIYTDKYGRVKVQFHWDREGQKDDKSSCWIRVSQLWAGSSWGAMWIPRIGHEVIVHFEEGDPDRPIIVGRVYNAQNMPPYGLDGAKTKSTIKSNSSKGGGGSNEYRFEDAKGSEEIYQHAQKDLTIKTENDKNQDTGHDETLKIGNDRSKEVVHDETTKVGNDRTEEVGNNETIKIGNDRSEEVGNDETIKIGNDRTENVGNNETVSIGNDRTEKVGNNETITIGKDKTVKIGANLTISVGSSLSASVDKASSVSIGDSSSTDVAKDVSLSAGKTYTCSAKDSVTISSDKDITIKCGKASIVMKKDGTITISGKDISAKGSGKINMKASKDMVLKGKKILEN